MRTDLEVGWGGEHPPLAAVWDPIWGARVYPLDSAPAARRDMPVTDPRWNDGDAPLRYDPDNQSGAVLVPVWHPLTITLGTLGMETSGSRWAARRGDQILGWDLYLLHRGVEAQGSVLAVHHLQDTTVCRMVLVGLKHLAAFLAGDRDPEWDTRPIEQNSYVFLSDADEPEERSVQAERVGTVVPTVVWTRRDWLFAVRAIYGEYLSVDVINIPDERVRRYPGLSVVGVDGLDRYGCVTIFRTDGGMLVDMVGTESATWEPSREWVGDDFNHVVFRGPGRWITGEQGRLTFQPCGCAATVAETSTLLRMPQYAPHPAHACLIKRRP